jgi:valyl-tRNA synthetase
MSRLLSKLTLQRRAEAIYQFSWATFCDWYVELVKPILTGGDEAAKAETRAVAAHVLGLMLRLLHPFMPFITEALWSELGSDAAAKSGKDGVKVLALSPWPKPDFRDDEAAAEINWLVNLISSLRSVRNEMNVPHAARTELVIVGASELTRHRLQKNAAPIGVMARVTGIEVADRVPPSSAQLVVGEATAALPLAGIIDFAAERARLEKEIARAEGEVGRIDRKLANDNFVARAPEEVVDAERDKRAAYVADLERLHAALRRLKDAG